MTIAEAIAGRLGIELCDVQAIRTRTTNEGRVHFATTGDGTEVVVKWFDDPERIQSLATVIDYSTTLIARGYPCPATIAHGPVGGIGHVWIQQRMPGRSCTKGLNESVLAQLFDVIELQAGAEHEPGSSDFSWVTAVVFDDVAGWWREAERVARATVDHLRDWIADVEAAPCHDDYVHLDMNLSNVLARGNELTAIVDIDLIGLGSRAVDLTKLAFEFEGLAFDRGRPLGTSRAELVRHRTIEVCGEQRWREAVAYHSVAWLGWVGPTGLRVDVERAVAVVESLIGLRGRPATSEPVPEPSSH